MIKVNWRHFLLDPDVYARAGTWRVARVRAQQMEFPIWDSGTYTDSGVAWTARADGTARGSRGSRTGYAPERYENVPHFGRDETKQLGGRTFLFHFWVVKIVELPQRAQSQVQERIASWHPAVPGPLSIRIDADAYYVWDQGVGPGSHAVMVDAFDKTYGDFMADDFVDVAPDPSGALTAAANNGLMSTEQLETEVTITARLRAPDERSEYTFDNWLDRLRPTVEMGRTPPESTGRDVKPIRTADIYLGTAFYQWVLEHPLPEVDVPGEWFRIAGGLAGGNLLIIGPGEVYGSRPTGPLPPDETFFERWVKGDWT